MSTRIESPGLDPGRYFLFDFALKCQSHSKLKGKFSSNGPEPLVEQFVQGCTSVLTSYAHSKPYLPCQRSKSRYNKYKLSASQQERKIFVSCLYCYSKIMYMNIEIIKYNCDILGQDQFLI